MQLYQKDYAWVLDAENGLSLAGSNDSFWWDFLTRARNWRVISYQQDWLCNQVTYFRPSQTEINLHYIMADPRHILNAIEISRVRQVRASGDYAYDLLHATGPQWKIGITSMILDAMGSAPNKDVLWSTSQQDLSVLRSY